MALEIDDVKFWLTFSFYINIWLAFVCEAPIMQAKRRRNGKPNNPAQAEGNEAQASKAKRIEVC